MYWHTNKSLLQKELVEGTFEKCHVSLILKTKFGMQCQVDPHNNPSTLSSPLLLYSPQHFLNSCFLILSQEATEH